MRWLERVHLYTFGLRQRFRVRFLLEPPLAVDLGAVTWRICYEHYGKGGKRAALMARCSDGQAIAILDGRESATAHQLATVETETGEPLHRVWLKLQALKAVELIPLTRERATLPPGCDRWLVADGFMIPLRAGYRPRSAEEVAKIVREFRARRGAG